VIILRSFKSNDFASAGPKGLAGAFFASADSKRVAGVDVVESVTM